MDWREKRNRKIASKRLRQNALNLIHILNQILDDMKKAEENSGYETRQE